MLIVSQRCRDIAGDLSSLLYAPSVPPLLWRWWPYREGVEWVAGHNLPAGPLDALAGLRSSVASAPAMRHRAKVRGGNLKWPFWHYSLSWHPRESPGREEMERAARKSFRVLDLAARPALLVAHRGPPRHLHVVASRSSLLDGCSAPARKLAELLVMEAELNPGSDPYHPFWRGRHRGSRLRRERTAPWHWEYHSAMQGWLRIYEEPLSPCPEDDVAALRRFAFRAELRGLLSGCSPAIAVPAMRHASAGRPGYSSATAGLPVPSTGSSRGGQMFGAYIQSSRNRS